MAALDGGGQHSKVFRIALLSAFAPSNPMNSRGQRRIFAALARRLSIKCPGRRPVFSVAPSTTARTMLVAVAIDGRWRPPSRTWSADMQTVDLDD